MPDEPVRLRPIEEADLDSLRRFDIDPSSRGPYLSSGFRSPQIRRRRWEEDGWLGGDSGQLAVARPDGTLTGIVAWRSIQTGGPEIGCLQIGILLFPEDRGQGLGTAAQRLLAQYLFATTLANPTPGHHQCREHRRAESAGTCRVPPRGVLCGLAFDSPGRPARTSHHPPGGGVVGPRRADDPLQTDDLEPVPQRGPGALSGQPWPHPDRCRSQPTSTLSGPGQRGSSFRPI
jgi:Acetyltransferase (GNAT) domain